MSYRRKRNKITCDEARQSGKASFQGAIGGDGHSTSATTPFLHSTHGGERTISRDAHLTSTPTSYLPGTYEKERATSGDAYLTSATPPPYLPDTHSKESVQESGSSLRFSLIREGGGGGAQAYSTLHVKGKGATELRPHKPVNCKLHTPSTSAPLPNLDLSMEVAIIEANSEPVEMRNECVKVSQSKPTRPRTLESKHLGTRWPDIPDFNEKEEFVTIDEEGKLMKFSGPVQGRDIDNLEVGVKCIVHFNDFNQPIRKGGSVLGKYLGYLAKNKRFCPIGETTWDHVHDKYKAKIIQLVRYRFVIPEGEKFNSTILMRVAKHWRQYKFSLKAMKFDPKARTKEQIYDDVPHGQDRTQWIRLVDYWFSEESEKLSAHGKEARASKSHVHITGSTSYANKRADFVEAKGRHPSHLEFFKVTHTKVGGGFAENTASSQFLVDANAKVQELVSNASSSKSEIEIENDVFESIMYEEGKPKKPFGFGLGVNESDVFGVPGLLRKTRCDSNIGMNSSMEVESLKAKIANMEEEKQVALARMKKENQQLKARVDQTNQILQQTLNEIRTGTVSSQFMLAAQSAALHVADSQAGSTSDDECTVEDFPEKN